MMRHFTKKQIDKWFNKPSKSNRKEFFFLKDVLQKHKVKSMVEIGVWKGTLTRFIMEWCPDISEYWAIDPWQYIPSSDDQMDDYYRQLSKHQWNQAAFDAYCIMQTYPERVNIIRLPSINAADLFINKYFDCIFIDGDHSYEGCLSDLQTWHSKFKKGGLICGDDIHRKSVKKAIQDITPQINLQYKESYGLYWMATI